MKIQLTIEGRNEMRIDIHQKMNMISLQKRTILILLIWLTTNKTEINSLELNCTITTPQTHLNPTQKDVEPIKAVNKCAKDYPDFDMIRKCEYFVNSDLSKNTSSLYKPVTNRFKNITYWNEFCATCNYETELEYFQTWTPLHNLSFVCTTHDREVLIGSVANDLQQITRNFTGHGLKLTSKLGNSTELQCSADENWPLNMLHFLVPCLTDQFRKNQEKKLYSCSYVNKEGRVCADLSVIIEGIDFVWYESNDFYLFEPRVYQSGYIFKSELDDVAYLCAYTYEIRGVRYWVQIFVCLLSIICLVIYLLLNFTEEYLQSFLNKMIYSYAIGLLISRSLVTFIFLLFPLMISVTFLSYSFLFFWTIIMSLEFCRLTYSTLRKRKVTVSSQSKRYLIYCFVGYVIPAVLIVIYFLILESNEKQCSQLPDHFGVVSGPLEKSVAWYFMYVSGYIFNVSLSIVLPILFVLLAGVLIYITKCGPTSIRSTANRNYTIVLMKMACIMGIQWMMNIFSHVYQNHFIDEATDFSTNAVFISGIIVHFQGVFVFFAFGFKKSWIYDVLYKCGLKEKSTRQSMGVGTSETVVQFTLSSVQMSDSAGTKE